MKEDLDEVALITAETLLQIKAIKLNNQQPFTWASGIKSPIYCDNRRVLSYPKIRTFIRQEMTRIITTQFGPIDVIAGVATGGIAIGALVAQDLGLPFVYVRSDKKGHGLENQIEGVLESGQSVVVIEDLISTGRSSLNAVEAIRNSDCIVKGMVAIFSYELEDAFEAFKEANCTLYTLTNYTSLIAKALEQKYIQDSDMQSLIQWRVNPKEWGGDK